MVESVQQDYDLSDLETVDDPAAPQIFLDGFWGLAIADGVAPPNRSPVYLAHFAAWRHRSIFNLRESIRCRPAAGAAGCNN